MKSPTVTAIAIALGCGVGHATPTPHKPPPDKFTAAAAAAFDKAIAAEKTDHWSQAISYYEQAFELAPAANTMFNVGALYAAHDKFDQALVAYQLYIELASSAADRAEGEARITALLTTPRTFKLRGSATLELATAYVLVDGDVVARPGQIRGDTFDLRVASGEHWVTVVTPISSGTTTFGFGDGNDRNDWDVGVTVPARSSGNVVVTQRSNGFSLQVATQVVRPNTRVAVPPGSQWVKVRDRDERYECEPFQLDAPKGDDVVAVFVAQTEHVGRREVERCRAHVVKQQHLVFP